MKWKWLKLALGMAGAIPIINLLVAPVPAWQKVVLALVGAAIGAPIAGYAGKKLFLDEEPMNFSSIVDRFRSTDETEEDAGPEPAPSTRRFGSKKEYDDWKAQRRGEGDIDQEALEQLKAAAGFTGEGEDALYQLRDELKGVAVSKLRR